ncbi:hypothetical protein LQ953_08695 [Sphingomonas sp. IC-56]|uniref:hypothetical protein n=1 Tax=Sphingomonas sp. IC-56 TaxID=2898529 RepID=UPI001E46A0E7|nr:hypothetical protein [Sphingomonas sp. IC-56]MCD2324087.1 hypothetical protein [Sphingomonas sp. IC-56]
MRLVALGLLVCGCWSAPAAAQTWGGYDPSPFPAAPRTVPSRVARDLGKLREERREGRAAGQLSRHDVKALRRDERMLGRLEARFARGGLSDSEAAELQVRTEILRAQVAARRTRGLN